MPAYDEGWIKLHRRIQKDWVWDFENPRRTLAWIDLLMMANHEDNEIRFNGKPLLIKRGSFVTSEVKLATRWCCSRRTVHRYLCDFEEDGMITRRADNKKTVITVENYSKFQSLDGSGAQQNSHQARTNVYSNSASNVTSSAHQAPTNKNERMKECKNERMKEGKKTYIGADPLPEIDSLFSLYEQCGGMFTQYAVEELHNLEAEYGLVWIETAIRRAADRGKVTISYIKGILKNWKTNGGIDNPNSKVSNAEKAMQENMDFMKNWVEWRNND